MERNMRGIKRAAMMLGALAVSATAAAGFLLQMPRSYSAEKQYQTVDGITWSYVVENGKAIVFGSAWFEYDYEEGEYSDFECTTAIPRNTRGAITVPSELGGYPVVAVGDGAFSECRQLTSVTVPSGVTYIGADAFTECTALTSVTMPSSVTYIGSDAFSDCVRLAAVSLPDGLDAIDDYAFDGCRSLTSIYIPPSVKTIGYKAFADCKGLSSIKVPKSLAAAVVSDDVFYGCRARVEYYSGETPAPAPAPVHTYAPEGQPVICEEVDGAVPFAAASEYNGYLYDDAGTVKGTMQIKVGKPNAKSGFASVKATVQPAGQKKVSLKAEDGGKAVLASGCPTTVALTGGEPCEVTFGENGIIGSYGNLYIDGDRNLFASKDKSEQNVANAALEKLPGAVNVKFDGGTAMLTIAKKGKVKATVVLDNGAKEIVNSQLLVGDDGCCIPVVGAKNANVAFSAWLAEDGGIAISGLSGAIAGAATTPAASLTFSIEGGAVAWAAAGLPGEARFLPSGFVFQGGAKWKFAKADSIKYANGSFKGSFAAYAVENGRLKKHTVNVTGVMIGAQGYGVASIKNLGSVAVCIEPSGGEPVVDRQWQLGGVQLWKDGPYWAECNVGATKPEEYGYYFWWGDTVGYKRRGSGWVSSKDGKSFTFLSSSAAGSTLGKDNSALQSEGYIDSTGNLDAAHDAATAHLGAPWRMPTSAEIDALIANCTTTWTTRNGVNGRLVTGKGDYADRSIFLPAAGCGYASGLDESGSSGHYWSSTPDSGNSYLVSLAWGLYFYSGNFDWGDFSRCFGQSVRPVRGFAK